MVSNGLPSQGTEMANSAERPPRPVDTGTRTLSKGAIIARALFRTANHTQVSHRVCQASGTREAQQSYSRPLSSAAIVTCREDGAGAIAKSSTVTI